MVPCPRGRLTGPGEGQRPSSRVIGPAGPPQHLLSHAGERCRGAPGAGYLPWTAPAAPITLSAALPGCTRPAAHSGRMPMPPRTALFLATCLAVARSSSPVEAAHPPTPIVAPAQAARPVKERAEVCCLRHDMPVGCVAF